MIVPKNGDHYHPRTTMDLADPALTRKPLPPKRPSGISWTVWILGFGLVLMLIALVVILRHHQTDAILEKVTDDMAVPSVLVIHAERQDAQVKLVLPGTVQANMETSIYARTDGYLKRWLVDIGASVKQGQLLAEIDTPEVDQQLNQAVAALGQAQADLNLSQINADRANKLLSGDAVSQQEVDQKNADLAVKKANLAADQADMKRLQEMQSFQKVVAPFDGVVTLRKTQVGDLISSGSSTANQELFRVAQINVLRVYANVPEAYSGEIIPGTEASIEFATTPGQLVTGKVVRTAGAIDPTSLTLLTEIDVANDEGKYLPGGYAQVHFSLALKTPPLLIPANTLIFRSQGTQVGVVDVNNTVHLVSIRISRDFGNRLEVLSGLTDQDSIILNPSDSLTDGTVVHAELKPPTSAK